MDTTAKEMLNAVRNVIKATLEGKSAAVSEWAVESNESKIMEKARSYIELIALERYYERLAKAEAAAAAGGIGICV